MVEDSHVEYAIVEASVGRKVNPIPVNGVFATAIIKARVATT